MHQPRIPLAGEELLRVLCQPPARFVDADQDRLEPGAVERGEHVARRKNRDLVLGGLATEEDRHSDLFTPRHQLSGFDEAVCAYQSNLRVKNIVVASSANNASEPTRSA